MDRTEHADLLAEAERALVESEGLLTQLRQAEEHVQEMIGALKTELEQLKESEPTENGIV